MGFFNQLQYRLANWMQGRRGVDRLSNALIILAIVLIVIDMLTNNGLFYLLALIALAVSLFRTFSRNISARGRENASYEALIAKPRTFFSNARTAWCNRKTTIYFKCSGCKTVLSVPRGKGTIRVTCPKCHTQQVRKS